MTTNKLSHILTANSLLLFILIANCSVSNFIANQFDNGEKNLAPTSKSPQLATKDEAIDEISSAVDPTFSSISFSSSNLELPESAPDDILQQIWYSIGGGGWGGCPSDFPEPAIYYATQEVEFETEIDVRTCGWNLGETVQVVVTFPDGSSSTFSEDFNGSAVIYMYKPDILTDPEGHYLVQFIGDNQVIQKSVEVVYPNCPRMYWKNWDKRHEEPAFLVLFNFSAGEAVKIYAYIAGKAPMNSYGEEDYLLYAWQEYIIPENGNLIVQSDLKEIRWYAAIGDVSGEVFPLNLFGVHPPSVLDSSQSNNPPPLTAPGPIPSTTSPIPTQIQDSGDGVEVEFCQLQIGAEVEATANARLWSNPDVISGELVAEPQANAQMVIVDGPVLGQIRFDTVISGWWWRVQYREFEGWIWQGRISNCPSQ